MKAHPSKLNSLPMAATCTRGQKTLGPLRITVVALQAMTQAPIEVPAQPALAVASLAIQGFADLETLGGTRPLSPKALNVARCRNWSGIGWRSRTLP